ncbi:MAG: protein kinase [Gemmatimonadota bacterium]|nr:MAG: protein kinase [Gemmatimonadota bacterium]
MNWPAVADTLVVVEHLDFAVSRGLLKKRDSTRPPRSGSYPASGGLPVDLQQRASRRLSIAALTYAVVYLLAYGLVRLTQDFALQWGYTGIYPSDVAAAVFIGLSLSLFLIAWSHRLECHRILDLGLVYEVVGVVGIEIGILFWSEWPAGTETAPLSWSCVWIVVFPLLVPSTPRKTLIAALTAASVRPLLYLIAVNWHLQPLPLETVLALVLPAYICAGIALVGARVVYGLGRDIRRARRMGSYQLIELLGVGGMGEVWRAEHRMLARPAAVKLIRSDGGSGGSGRSPDGHIRRFEREVQATALLRSPHTVEVYDYGLSENHTFYYVMELLDGISLEDLVKQHGPVSPSRAIHILRQACHSLAEAHHRGLVHRDVKPGNIFICHQGLEFDFVKVLDFGLVKQAGESEDGELGITKIGSFIGTPAYGSPEMASGSDLVEATSDIYSLACVAYWLLTGRTVFEAPSLPLMLVKHLNEEPKPPSRYSKEDIPAPLDGLILECLRKDPDQRPQSVTTLADRLTQIDPKGAWTQSNAADWWMRFGRVERPKATPITPGEAMLLSKV